MPYIGVPIAVCKCSKDTIKMSQGYLSDVTLKRFHEKLTNVLST